MKYLWETDGKPRLLEINLRSDIPQKCIVSVADADIPNSLYSHQDIMVNGSETLEISLPITPKKMFFEVKPADIVGLPWGGSQYIPTISFDARELKFIPRECSINKHLKEFLDFASWISKYKNVLDTDTYKSSHGTFQFTYLPEIIDDDPWVIFNGQKMRNPNFGKPLPTSYRVNSITGEIQGSKKYLVNYTFPMSMTLFTHEYAHLWLNKNPDDEKEADFMSVSLCRCLGFGKREIANAYVQVFLRFPSDENVERIRYIKELLKNVN